ncbi:MAG TPA: efflux transporter outer membrane subunit [Caldimonas sp.]|nr:efflux transporter outer membrane subunit [Caldimonas sp.]
MNVLDRLPFRFAHGAPPGRADDALPACVRRLPTVAALAIALASSVVLVLAGCASTNGIAPQATKIEPARIGLTDTSPQPPLATDWWTALGDATLDALVDRALADSPTLKASQARVERARANVGTAEAARSPQVNGVGNVTREHLSENGIFPPPLGGATFTLSEVQAQASWDLDLFGRNRAALEAAVGNELAAQADRAAARLVLATNVVRTYLQLARFETQRDVAARALQQRGETFGLVQQRVQAGIDTNVELHQSEGALPETRQQIESFDEQIAIARHALAALTAQPPTALDNVAPRLADMRAIGLPVTVPADLLGRRPDIVAARWRIEAALQDVAVARAEFYPNINLTAFVGLNTIGVSRLLHSGSDEWGVGPAIRLPIFDAGRLRANLRARSADVDSAVETYNGSVLDAVRDAVDQIASLQSIDRQRREQAQATASAESAYDLALQRYRAGLGTYLTVLTAETNVLQQRRQSADLEARALDTQVALVRALGGGYADASTATASR